MLSKPSDVAKRIGVSRVAVYKAIRAGRLPAVRVFGGTGPLRVFTAVEGEPLRAAPEPGTADLVDAPFLARRLRVSATLVRAACAAGLIDAIRLPGGTSWRILADGRTWLPLPPSARRDAGSQNEREVASRRKPSHSQQNRDVRRSRSSRTARGRRK